MLYCVVCFYNERHEGSFTIDYIFRDKKNAVLTTVKFMKAAREEEPQKYWPILIESDSLPPQFGTYENIHVYIDMEKKKLYMFMSKQDLCDLNYDALPVPYVSTSVPDDVL